MCIRIGSFGKRPTSARTLGTWLSECDAVQLFTKAVTVPTINFLVVYGVSRSRWSSWENPGAALPDYTPLDDVEDAAADGAKQEAEEGGGCSRVVRTRRRNTWIAPPRAAMPRTQQHLLARWVLGRGDLAQAGRPGRGDAPTGGLDDCRTDLM